MATRAPTMITLAAMAAKNKPRTSQHGGRLLDALGAQFCVRYDTLWPEDWLCRPRLVPAERLKKPSKTVTKWAIASITDIDGTLIDLGTNTSSGSRPEFGLFGNDGIVIPRRSGRNSAPAGWRQSRGERQWDAVNPQRSSMLVRSSWGKSSARSRSDSACAATSKAPPVTSNSLAPEVASRCWSWVRTSEAVP
jgi:hypothetical protein